MLRFARLRRVIFPTLEDLRRQTVEEIDRHRVIFATAVWSTSGEAPMPEHVGLTDIAGLTPAAPSQLKRKTASDASGPTPDPRAATSAAPPPGVNVANVSRTFASLVERAKKAQSEEELNALVDEAKSLSQLRAFLYSQPGICQMYLVGLSTMKGWGIPQDEFADLCDATKACRADELGPARNALHTTLRECDRWSDYVDSMVLFHRRLAGLFLLLAGVAGFFSVNRFLFGDVVYGFLLGGFTGALLSVTSRLPAVPRYESHVTGILSIFSRIGAGLVATVLGGSLIAMNVISVNIPGEKTTLAEIVERCGTGSLPVSASVRNSPASENVHQEEVAGVTPAPGRCETGQILLLLGLSLLLGFTERALPSFERRMLPQST